MTIDEILDTSKNSPSQIVDALTAKEIFVPNWFGRNGLEREYNPMHHPVMSKAIYPDVATKDGIEKVSRITYDMQRLAVKRMTELCVGLPVKRLYHPENDKQKEVAKYLEAIFQKNRIDSSNIERCNMLYASCETMTLWYTVKSENNDYGFKSPLKLRCRNFSPMRGDKIYPLFDEYGDLIALSVEYKVKTHEKETEYFDTYTKDKHLKWSNESSLGWKNIENENITLGKIPAVYMWRPTPIWEQTSPQVYEMEWAMSRNGNYLRKNSKPIFIVYADEEIEFNQTPDERKTFKDVLKYPKGSSAGYVTWEQATESLKFYIDELKQQFFTQLQLPDWSYESMKATPMSGESRKQLFIDAQLKVKDESGRLLEFFDREVNVVKSFLKIMLNEKYKNDIDALSVETQITPFTITDERDTIDNIMAATGGKAIMSQKQGIEMLGYSNDAEKTLSEIRDESKEDAISLAE